MKKTLIMAAVLLTASLTQSQPFQPADLQLRVRLQPYVDVGLGGNTMYNPRVFDGDLYIVQINTGCYCFGRYPSGSSIFEAAVNEMLIGKETRMVTPFRGSLSSTYLLASGGTLSPFTRYDFDGNNPVDAAFPDGQLVESFDWVNDHTIICTDYSSGNRKRLYLVDVTAEPFALAKNSAAWLNGLGYKTTSVTTRIRNVRMGDKYPKYAYYGDNGVVNPKIYALNVETGVETQLGSWDGTLKAWLGVNPPPPESALTGSWGLWTVVERGGYLYLQSSDDGIQVYSMIDATTMGPKVATYQVTDLQAATGNPERAIYGFDVASNGNLLLGFPNGSAYEVGPPTLTVTPSGTDLILSWPESVTAVVLQSSSSLDSASFTDIYPYTYQEGQMNKAVVTPTTGPEFFRLRKTP